MYSFVTLLLAACGAAAPANVQRRATLPAYALTFAPISYLYSGEIAWPSNISTHLEHVIPEESYVAIGAVGSVTVNNVNNLPGDVFLTSADDITKKPAWLLSAYGKPDSTGFSAAPGTIIAVEKNTTTTDVFYFYFYSYNNGRPVLGIQFDNHVGDWEHVAIRFVDGQPSAIYLSQHGAGSAYQWGVLQSSGNRPVTYIASGSHANYALAGTQQYTVSGPIVTDITDKGSAWDITKNYRGYTYDVASNAFSTAGGASTGATEETGETATWLDWLGAWGDEQYKTTDSRQLCLLGECRYTSGPTGPVAKHLDRASICQNDSGCVIFDNIQDLTKQS